MRLSNSIIIVIIKSSESRLSMNKCCFFLVLRKTFLGCELFRRDARRKEIQRSDFRTSILCAAPYGCFSNCRTVSPGGPDLEEQRVLIEAIMSKKDGITLST